MEMWHCVEQAAVQLRGQKATSTIARNALRKPAVLILDSTSAARDWASVKRSSTIADTTATTYPSIREQTISY